MSDTQFFHKPNLFSGTSVSAVTERRHTWKSRLAISGWTALLLAALFIAYIDFAMFNRGIEWFIDIQIRLVPNFRFEPPHPYHTYVPLVDWMRYPLVALTVWAGYKSFKRLVLPPPTRTFPVRVEATRLGTHEIT